MNNFIDIVIIILKYVLRFNNNIIIILVINTISVHVFLKECKKSQYLGCSGKSQYFVYLSRSKSWTSRTDFATLSATNLSSDAVMYNASFYFPKQLLLNCLEKFKNLNTQVKIWASTVGIKSKFKLNTIAYRLCTSRAGLRPAGAQDFAQHQHGDCCQKTLQIDKFTPN